MAKPQTGFLLDEKPVYWEKQTSEYTHWLLQLVATRPLRKGRGSSVGEMRRFVVWIFRSVAERRAPLCWSQPGERNF